MPFNFHVGLPGPFSYNKRIGGGSPGPGAAEQIEQLQIERARRDLYCPAHLRTSNIIGWVMLVVSGLIALWIFGPWSIPVFAVLATLTWGRHQFRHQRRAPHLDLLAGGSGCELCEKTAAKAARVARNNPLAQIQPRAVPAQRTEEIPRVRADVGGRHRK